MLEDLGNLKDQLLEYIELRVDHVKLQSAEVIARIVSNTLASIVIIFLLSLILLFLSFTGAYLLGSLLGSEVLGFLCVAGFYIVLLLLFIFFRKWLIDRPVIKSVLKMFYPNDPGNGKA